MSHGPSTEGGKCEPNLTPLLDVVLQLLMFFMMCVNFVSEQVNKEIKLPVAQSAVPMDKNETSVLFLNVDRDGRLVVPGHDPMKNLGEMKYYLSQQYDDTKRTNKLKGLPEDVKTAIVIRADESCDYSQVYQLLRTCKEVGYTKLQLRALTKAS